MAFSLPFGQLNSFIGQMQNQARGRGPSAAERLLRSTNNQQMAQTAGAAASQRGPQSQALAFRNAQRINAQRQAQTNASAGALRSQEQMGAQQMLSPLLQQQQAAQLAGLGGAIDTVNAGRGSTGSWLGAAATMAPLLLSDERRKRIVGRARGAGERAGAAVGNSMRRFLRSLNPTQFTYDNEAAGARPRTGVTAQDVGSTEEGRHLVVNTPEGAAIDTRAATGALLGAAGHQQSEIDELRAELARLRGDDPDIDEDDEAVAMEENREAIRDEARRQAARRGPSTMEVGDISVRRPRLPPLAFGEGAVPHIVRGATRGMEQVTPAQREMTGQGPSNASRAPGTRNRPAQRAAAARTVTRPVGPVVEAAARTAEATRRLLREGGEGGTSRPRRRGGSSRSY